VGLLVAFYFIDKNSNFKKNKKKLTDTQRENGEESANKWICVGMWK